MCKSTSPNCNIATQRILRKHVWTQETSGKQIYIPDRGRVKHRALSLIIRSGITNSNRNSISCLHVYANVESTYCLIVSLLKPDLIASVLHSEALLSRIKKEAHLLHKIIAQIDTGAAY